MNDREKEFKNKLFALLREYDVTMQAVETWRVGVSNPDININFHSNSFYDDKGNRIADDIDFDIGWYENGKEE